MPLPWDVKETSNIEIIATESEEEFGSQSVVKSVVVAPSVKRHANQSGYKAPAVSASIDFDSFDVDAINREANHNFKNRQFTRKRDHQNAESFEENFSFYEANLITDGFGDDFEPYPVDIDDCPLDERLKKNVQVGEGFNKLNPLQVRSVPIIIEGLHLLVQAPTGIGKTAAFLLPAIQKVIDWKKQKSVAISSKSAPSVLILNNTRHLAEQTFETAQYLIGANGNTTTAISEVTVECCTSGRRQEVAKSDIIVGTIGRLTDRIDKNELSLANLKLLIVDEADKMISMDAFGNDMEKIYDELTDECREYLQVCFFSATYECQEGGIVLTPLQRKLTGEAALAAILVPVQPGYITQHVYQIKAKNDCIENTDFIQKMNAVRHLIDKDLKRTGCTKDGYSFVETIGIFCETTKAVNTVTTILNLAGYKFAPLSRMISRPAQSLNMIKVMNKEIQGIVTTNIMARGIDITSLRHIIIFEMSKDFDTYRHRIGRTGRAGQGGTASVLINMSDYRTQQQIVLAQLHDFLLANNQQVPRWLMEFADFYREQIRLAVSNA